MNVKLNKGNVRKWVKALRSGRYKQIHGQLYNEEGYCCLGVACRVAGMRPFGESFGEESAVLPKRAMRWLGVEDDNPKIGRFAAATLNDEKGYSFSQIADAIEKHWLGKSKEGGKKNGRLAG